MSTSMATAPATLAGTLSIEHAEIMAGIVMAQMLAPGLPVTYWGIPHIMDPRTGICSFGSPEQGLMAVAMIQMARLYGFGAYEDELSRDYRVIDHGKEGGSPGLFTLTGGKLAAYRLMAEDMADHLAAELGVKEPCRTGELPRRLSTISSSLSPAMRPSAVCAARQ